MLSARLDLGAFYLWDIPPPPCVPYRREAEGFWWGWGWAGQECCPCGAGTVLWGGRELLSLEEGSPRGTQLSPFGWEWKELVDTKDNWLWWLFRMVMFYCVNACLSAFLKCRLNTSRCIKFGEENTSLTQQTTAPSLELMSSLVPKGVWTVFNVRIALPSGQRCCRQSWGLRGDGQTAPGRCPEDIDPKIALVVVHWFQDGKPIHCLIGGAAFQTVSWILSVQVHWL